MAKEETKGEENKTLTDVKKALMDINKRAAERKAERDVARAAANEARKKRMSNKPAQRGSSIQGLETSFGKKIIS